MKLDKGDREYKYRSIKEFGKYFYIDFGVFQKS